MRLLTLTLTNFKGARNVTIEPKGQNLAVFGDNSVGKTTLADAYYWLLFGKDSANRADFGVKTIVNGQPLSGVEHSVEGTFEMDGKTVTLKRVYRENWVTTRGQSASELKGHVTEYFWQGVPVTAGEYGDRIKSLVGSEKAFRLLVDPAYFVETLDWKERREFLFDAIGETTVQQVVERTPALDGFLELLGGYTVDDFAAMTKATRKKLADERQALPGRIDEASRSLPPAGLDASAIKADADRFKAELAALRTKRSEAASGGLVSDLSLKLAGRQRDLIQRESALRSQPNPAREAALEKVKALKAEGRAANSELEDLNDQLGRARRHAASAKSDTEELLRKYYAERDREWSGDETCATCGQAIPAEKIEALRATFNAAKATKLEQIKAEGTKLREVQNSAEALAKEIEAKVQPVAEKVTRLVGQVKEAEALVPAESAFDPSADAEYAAIQADVTRIQTELDAARADTQKALREIDAEINGLELRADDANRALARLEAGEAVKARIEELKAREKTLAVELEKADHALAQVEAFIRAKTEFVTSRINALFSIATFKLFDNQINGGLRECCEVMYRDVPYRDLNTGMRLNVGLDVIDTLSARAGFAPPIFIDNAESVTRIRETAGQQIRLIVSASDDTLRAEVIGAPTKQPELQEAF